MPLDSQAKPDHSAAAHTSPCDCPTCRASRALRDLSAAVDGMVEMGGSTEIENVGLRAENERLREHLRWALGRVILTGCFCATGCATGGDGPCTCDYTTRPDHRQFAAATKAAGPTDEESRSDD